jgi:NAD(P)H-hydrate epimerase
MNDLPLPRLPPRPQDAHKGSFGTVVVVGGSPTMIGAPCLVAGAALRSGCGMVRLAVQPEILPHCLVIEPSATGLVLPPVGYQEELAGLDPAAVIAVGPGLGLGEARCGLVEALWRSPNRLVVDADALTLLASLGRGPRPRDAATVLTPHPAECRRLTVARGLAPDPLERGSRAAAAQAVAASYGAVTVLKGSGTVVSDGRATALNRSGNPALAIPGSGDVLTGMIAALIAQGLDPFGAARLGAHLHGLAGDLWKERHGAVGLVARDLIALLPQACSRHAAETMDIG